MQVAPTARRTLTPMVATGGRLPAKASHVAAQTIHSWFNSEGCSVKLRLPIAITLVAAAAVGGGALALNRHHDAPFRNSPTASAGLDAIDPSTSSRSDAPVITMPAEVSGPGATSPAAAVSSLLRALVDGDARGSYALLAAPDRATYGPVGRWADELSQLPQYRSFRVAHADGPRVTTEVTTVPRLDEVVGYIPSRAVVTWTTADEAGGYRVAFSDTTISPDLPSNQAATAAALAWVEAQQRCQTGPTYAGNLLGQPVLAQALCHTGGTYRAGAPRGLETFRNPTALLSAFGAEAPSFVRVVPVDGARPLGVAVAPLGEHWEVVGVMDR
jgi:hypothetical protein